MSYLLARLGYEYDHFITSITIRVGPLSLDELYGHLLAHEMRLEQHQTSADLALSSANLASRTQENRSNQSAGKGSCGCGNQSSGKGRGNFFFGGFS